LESEETDNKISPENKEIGEKQETIIETAES
jgi:hypothetical protein